MDTARLEAAVGAVDRIYAAILTNGDHGPEERINIHDCIGMDHALLDLIDLPATFPKVWGLMGWNIYLFHTQGLILRLRLPLDPAEMQHGNCVKALPRKEL